MKTLLVLLTTGLLVACNALSLPTKRAGSAHQFVLDGGFEDIPSIDSYSMQTTLGNWTFTGRAAPVQDSPGNTTPYGKHYVAIYGGRRQQPRGAVQQRITGLSTNAMYMLGFATRELQSAEFNCTFVVSLGAQQLDSVLLPSTVAPNTQGFVEHMTSFKPAAAAGLLLLKVVCPPGTDNSYGGWEFDLDNISITGPKA